MMPSCMGAFVQTELLRCSDSVLTHLPHRCKLRKSTCVPLLYMMNQEAHKHRDIDIPVPVQQCIGQLAHH
jgi:hypothetical protein